MNLNFIKNSRTLNILFTVIPILIIGYIDINTGTEMAFSLFYIIPIIILSLHKKVKSQELLYALQLQQSHGLILNIHM